MTKIFQENLSLPRSEPIVMAGNRSNRELMILAGFLAFAFLLPFHASPFRAFFNDWLVVLGIAIVVAYQAEDSRIYVHAPWIGFIPVSLAIIIALQAAFGMLSERWDAFLPIVYFLISGVAIYLGASITARPSGATKLCLALAIGHLVAGLVSVVIATFQFVGAEMPFAPFMMLMLHPPGVSIRPHANLGQANHLALLFCVSLASVWWLFQTSRLKAGAAIAMSIFLLWGLVMTQSRIGWVILPAFGTVVWLWNRRAGARSVSSTLVAGLLLLYAVLIIALPDIASALNTTAASAAEHAIGGGRSERMELFRQAWKISLAHPWFGAGWFQFGPQQVMGSDLPASIYSHYAHNIVLNFAAELGWPITVVLCGVFGFWLFRCCLSLAISTEVAFATLVFVAMLVHSMVEYPFWYAMVLMPFSLLVGMVHQERFGSMKIELPRLAVLALAVMMTAGLLGVAMDYRRVVAGFNELEFNAMGVKIDESAKARPAFTAFPYAFDYLRFMDMSVSENMPSEDIAFMERVTKRFGGVLPLTRMSQVYAMNGREDDAVKSATAVQRLHGSRYNQVYESWRSAPEKYQNVFRRLPPPEQKPVIPQSGKQPAGQR